MYKQVNKIQVFYLVCRNMFLDKTNNSEITLQKFFNIGIDI